MDARRTAIVYATRPATHDADIQMRKSQQETLTIMHAKKAENELLRRGAPDGVPPPPVPRPTPWGRLFRSARQAVGLDE